jgi:signal transduction histidine kinase
MRLRYRSIRVRILALVIAPVVALIGLYAFALYLTYGSYVTLTRAKAVHNAITGPTTALQAQLDAERTLAMMYVSRPSQRGLAALKAQEIKTQNAATGFNQAIVTPVVIANGGSGEQKAAQDLHANLNKLATLQALVERRVLKPLTILKAYTGLVIQANYVLDQSILEPAGGSVSLQANALIGMDQVRQTVLQENDLIRADLRTHKFPVADRHTFADLVAVRNALVAVARPQLSPAYQAYFSHAVPSRVASRLTAMELAVVKLPPSKNLIKAPLRDWAPTVAAYKAGFRTAEQQTSASLNQQITAQSDAIATRLVLAGTLGLLAILIAAGVAVLVGRGVVSQLSRLRQSALELATRQLPDVIRRLRSGEDVNVEEHTQPPSEPTDDEIEQVRQAFAMVQRTALEAAVDEAKVRRGVNDVFRNLARRSQSLLNRQLALLDTLERRAQGPEELANLFRLDHLTTRMRRHAEGLLILSGVSSGRSWRDPVPVVDVVRAAVAEVEDYTRFRVLSTTSAAVAGFAVADVVHLLAELAENATIFSPVSTPVRVEGSAVARGVAVEIEDRGLGISEDDLAAINARLADPPQFDLSGADQLGLFIAARLAQRHDIKITLRQSAYGGTTAVVLLPAALIVEPEPDGALPAGPGQYLSGKPLAELPAGAMAAGRDGADSNDGQPGHDAAAADTGVFASLFAADQPWPRFRRPDGDHDGGLVTPRGKPPWPDAEFPSQAATAGGLLTGASTGFFTGASGFDSEEWPGSARTQDGPIGSSPATSPAVRPASTAARPPWDDAEPPGPAVSQSGRLSGFDLRDWTAPDSGARPPATGTGPADDLADLPVRIPQAGAGPEPGAPALDVHAGNGDLPDLPVRVPAAGDGGSASDLPLRIPQANLAPQLRGGHAGRQPVTAPAPSPTPESARNTMSAWQRGWERGRSAAAGSDDAAEPPEG